MADTVGKFLIEFEGKGSNELRGQLTSLTAAINTLSKTQKKLVVNGKETVKNKKKLNQSAVRLTAQLKAQNLQWKQLGISNKTIQRAYAGSTTATEKMRGALKQSTTQTRILGGAFSVLRSKLLIYTFAITGVLSVFRALHGAVSEFEVALGKLNGVLRSTGFISGKTSQGLADMANQIQVSMGVSNTAVMEMQGRLLTFTNIVGQQFDKTIELAIDMSSVLGTDMNSAIIQMGKALNDPIKGVTALTRVGVSFTNQQKEQIKAFQESGDIISAQNIILSELTTEFGGATDAINEQARSTARLKDLTNEWGDALREIGFATDGIVLILIRLGRAIAETTRETFSVINATTDWIATFLQTGTIFQQGIKDYTKFSLTVATTGAMIDKGDRAFKSYGEAVQKAVLTNKEFTNVEQLNAMVKEMEALGESASDDERAEIMNKVSEAIVKNNFLLRAQAEIIENETKVAAEEAKKVREQLEKDFTNLIKDQTQQRIDSVREEANAAITIINERKNTELAALRETFNYKKATDKQKEILEKEIINRHARQEQKERKEANKKMKRNFMVQQALSATETIISAHTGAAKATGQLGFFGLSVAQGILLQGYASAALILAQKPPKMRYGGMVGGNRHEQGGTMINAERGEFVMRREAVEAVGIETMNRINQGGGAGNINISFNGNVMSKDFIEDEAIPQIKEAIRRGADIGVG